MKLRERILIIEDEKPMRVALSDTLAAEGFRILLAEDGELGLRKAVQEKPNLILLDIMMSKLDGFALCSELRRLNIQIPILFLTARGMVQDRVAGLNAGADDYLVKPFSSEELLARVRALLRRSKRELSSPTEVVLGQLKINFATQIAVRNSAAVHLTAKEFAILRLFFDHPGEPISRERFLDAVWGYTAFPTTRTVDNHIATLRSKIEINPDEPQFIQTVHGVGYRLNFANP